jgi:hypothetical protein
MLNEALQCKSSCERLDDHLRELAAYLTLNWPASILVKSLSEEAFFYLFECTKRGPYNEEIPGDILSFKEYLRFRSIVEWWLYQSGVAYLSKESMEHIMNHLIPDKAGILEIWGSPGDPLEIAEETEEFLSVIDPLLIETMPKRLLLNIDFRLIHLSVLAS